MTKVKGRSRGKGREKALLHLLAGEFIEALNLYERLLRKYPEDPGLLEKAAECSIALGNAPAGRDYQLQQIAALNQAGRALESLAVVVRMGQLNASSANAGARLVAQAFAKRTGRAAALHLRTPVLPQSPCEEIPLLQGLSKNAFVEVAGRLKLHVLGADEILYRAGSRGERLFWLVSGQLWLGEPTERASYLLEPGEAFGQWGLLSEEIQATDAKAKKSCVLLSLSRSDLSAIHLSFPSVLMEAEKFCRRRLLDNFMSDSPLFGPFPEDARRILKEKMEIRRFPPRTMIWEEGQRPDSLYLVIQGRVEVFLRRSRGRRILGHLERGATFGEMSLMDRGAQCAAVKTTRKTVMLRLSRKGFSEVIASFPEMFVHLERRKRAGADAGDNQAEGCFTSASGSRMIR